MRVSVILPTLNEEKTIESTLQDLCSHQKPDEVIVVDGGSTDQTISRAKKWARVVPSEKGRARQMNVGAIHASGDIFLFLHADTRLPMGGIEKIKLAMDLGARAGRFRMRFDDPKWMLRVLSSYTRFHIFSYGDQGFFVARDLFDQLQGFQEKVPFEDIDFYKRLRQITKPIILKDSVTTSARRFSEVGCMRQKWINMLLLAFAYIGWDVKPLKQKLYPDIR